MRELREHSCGLTARRPDPSTPLESQQRPMGTGGSGSVQAAGAQCHYERQRSERYDLQRQHVCRDQVVQRPQRHSARADLIGQGRGAESHALSGVAFALPVQRLMRPILLEEDRRQQVRTCPAARRRMERRRRLGDGLTLPARELLAHRLYHPTATPSPDDRTNTSSR